MADVTLRDATHEDLPTILALWRQSERVQAGFRLVGYSGDPEERLTALARALLDDPEGTIVLAEEDGRPVGMMFLKLEAPSRMSDERAVDISRMVVDEGRRGRGLGPLLIDRAEAFARERGAAWLAAKIFSRNTAALRFWEREGFEALYEQRLRRVER